MSDSVIRNREEFLGSVHSLIDAYHGKIEYAEDPVRYRISVRDAGVSLIDMRTEGIIITGVKGDLSVSSEPVYNWSDAYTLMYMLTAKSINPDCAAVVYRENAAGEKSGRIDVMKTLGKPSFDFEWNLLDRIYDISDSRMEEALDLMKNGAVLNVYPVDLNGETLIRIDGNRSVCTPGQQGTKNVCFPLDFYLCSPCAQYECGKDSCLLGICGYLEYLYRKGGLYDFFLKRKNFRVPAGNYDFTWRPEDGLKTLREPVFFAANKLVELGQIVVEEKLGEDYRLRCRRSVNITDEINVLDLLVAICSHDRKPVIGYTVEIEKKLSEISDEYSLYFTAAAYIYYLKKTGQEKLVESDRQYYHANFKNEKIQQIKFEYSFNRNCYERVPKESWRIASLLQKEGYVSIYPKLHKNDKNEDCAEISVSEAVYKNLADIGTLEKKIKNGDISYAEGLFGYTISLPLDDPLETIFARANWPYEIGLAAFIDYLEMTGGLTDFENRLNRKWNEEKEDLIKSLGKIDNAFVTEKVIQNPDCDSLYCVIQGEDGTGRKENAIAIARALLDGGKIDRFNPVDDIYTFEMASYRLCHQSTPHAGDISDMHIYEDLAEDRDPVTMEDIRSSYFAEAPSSVNQRNALGFFERGTVTEKVNFVKRRIHILTDIKSFLAECEASDTFVKERVSHLMECLGRYSRDTYIILVDEEKYIDQLFGLYPGVRYMFGNAVISIEPLTAAELYEQFKKELSSDLAESLKDNKEYESKFIDFCTVNRKNFAMKNRELACFLANFANIHHDTGKIFADMEIYSSKSTEELLASVIGMDNVKEKVKEFRQFAIYRKYAENLGMDIPNSNMHMLFTGNPGTGKTMIARIVGQILYDVGIIEENKVVECEGKDLKGRYIGESGPKTAAKINEAMGGVLFVDEAYAIGNDSFGKEVIATLIKSMEDKKDRFVVIFAGYPKEMQEFININSGINSRIGYKFNFEDYNEDELCRIFDSKMLRAGYVYSDEEEIEKRLKLICRQFCKKKDFGNGRFVDKVIQQTVIKRAKRDYTSDTVNMLIPDDLPTEEEILTTGIIEHVPYSKQLEAIIGMNSVKKKIEEFSQYVRFRKEVMDKNPQAVIPDSNMHMIFTGNPGTGKTTIARIMVDLLYDVGILKERKYIEVERKDLVGEYVGKTAIKTGEIIDRALGGVLFIDEAYSLAPDDSSNDYGKEALATLIKAMEDHKGELIVIFAGYTDEMRRFEKINPGISSRIGYRFEFEDYSVDELAAMFSRKVKISGFSVNADAMDKVRTVLDYYRRKQNFGNGRFVGKLWQDTLTRHSASYDENTIMTISKDDIPTVADLNSAAVKKSNNATLDNIVGLKAVKEQMKVFESWVRFSMDAREKGLKIPAVSLHMIFSGNPGTGKTTVARIVAKKLYDLGVIMENKVIEVDRSKLVSNHVGETALKTHDVIESAMGGVLFIDEAYMLAEEGSEYNFGAEAVDTLMKVMEDKKDDLVVIFAGYKKEMKEFLDINPGIQSRIGYTFNFDDYSPEELLEIFERKMKEYEFVVDEQAKSAALELFKYFSQVENFGNGRFVDQVIRQTLMKQSVDYDFNTMNYIGANVIPGIDEMSVIMGGVQKKSASSIGFRPV